MDSLPKPVFEQMQRLGKVFVSDLGIDINEKDGEVKEYLINDIQVAYQYRGKLCCTMLPALSRVGTARPLLLTAWWKRGQILRVAILLDLLL